MYEFIETSLEELLCQHPDASVVLAGDFNKLNVTEISVRKGLLPLVKTPTRSGKILDMLMISPPQKYQVKGIRSAVRTDHSAVLTTTEAGVRDRTKTSYRKSFRRRSPEQHANLLLNLRNFDCGDKEVIEPEQAWREFYDVTLGWLKQFYSLRTVTVTSRDSPFVTPELKFLLRHRKRLMWRGRINEALTQKIGWLIERFNSRELHKIDKANGTKDLWAAVNRLTGARGLSGDHADHSAEDLNSHFAATSTDHHYIQLKMTVCSNH